MKNKGVWWVVLAVVAVVIIIFAISRGSSSNTASNTPYVYGADPAADAAPATPATFEQKQQCAKDGTAWFTTNVTDQATPQAIAQTNASLGTNDPSILTKEIYPSNPQYVFSTKLNTCLVDWAETALMMDGSTYTSHDITDVYTNKVIANWDWTQKPGQSIQNAVKGSDASSFNTAEFDLIQQQN